MVRPHWQSTLPSPAALRKGPFGNPDTNHSFIQDASFDTIAFFIISSGFLTEHDTSHLIGAHPPLQQLVQATNDLADYDFRWIRTPNPNWASQAEIIPEKPIAFLACLFHYNMDVSLVMHYLGGNYMAAHQNIDNIIQRISPYVDNDLLQHYRWIMTTGCPNVFNASCSRDNFMTYWLHSNNPSIAKKLDAVMKTMNKEE